MLSKLKALFANPTVRLALRALVAAAGAAIVQIHRAAGGTLAWHAVAVGAALAFAEVFTPLNQLVGFFKLLQPQQAFAVTATGAPGNTGSATATVTEMKAPTGTHVTHSGPGTARKRGGKGRRTKPKP